MQQEYKPRARGDNRTDSDWDLLILLDKPKLSSVDYDYGYPFREFGWDIGEEISPHIYTKKQWDEWTFLPYHKNVERDKIVLAPSVSFMRNTGWCMAMNSGR